MAAPQATATITPPGLHPAWRFTLFNSFSFQIVLGSPMILYAKTLGASATVLGIIVGMMPLLTIFQIPAANYIYRVGYKRFVLGGWGTRTVFIFAIALVPLAGGFFDATTRLVLILTLLFGFNLVRGISSCAWLPWIAALVPEHFRGKYLAREATTVNLGNFLTVTISALCLGAAPHPWQFAVIFAFSAVTGVISLAFLNSMPDVAIPEEVRTSHKSIPWLTMLRHPQFFKLLRVLVVWSVAYGGLPAFTVAFLKTETGMADGEILLVNSVAFVGGLSSLWLLGSRLDHLGSKPVLGFALGMWLVILVGWMALAGGALTTSLMLLLTLQFLMGLCAALVGVTNIRLAMAIVPPLGRNHFFAFYSVFASVASGLAPIAWGLLIDAVGSRHGDFLGLIWNRYTVFYGATAVVMVLAFMLARWIDEPKAASQENLLTGTLIASQQRFWPKE